MSIIIKSVHILRLTIFINTLLLLQACQPKENIDKEGENWQWELVTTQGTPTARHEASFVEHNGLMYLIGGRRINPTNVFDPSNNTWVQKSKPPLELHHFQAVSLGDAIYIVGAMTGGYPKESPLTHVIKYDPNTDTYTNVHEIPQARRRGGAGAVVYNDKIYLVGGITNGHIDGYKPWLDEYNPETGEWKVLPDATFARDHVQATVLNDKLYVFGGRTSRQRTNQVLELLVEYGEVFDLKKQQWDVVKQDLALPTLRAGNMLFAWGDEIIVAGGESHTQEAAHAEVDSFNVVTRKWRRWPNALKGRHGTGLAQANGYLYMASGSANRGGGPELPTMERLKLPDIHTTSKAAQENDTDTTITQNWHTITVDFTGPAVAETDEENPFTNYRLDVEFKNSKSKHSVRGFFAADGNAANTGADNGNVWRVHFTPDVKGEWSYSAVLRKGKNIAILDAGDIADAQSIPITNSTGTFLVVDTDKEAPDFRANGFLTADGAYFRFRNSNTYWIKAGANSPENMFGFFEFDGTYRHGQNERDGEASAGNELHRLQAHAQDWQLGDPTWQDGKGKNIFGAYNYLASKGMNSHYFLTMNINGDGKDVWPFISHKDFSRFDVSKLEQWDMVFSHMQAKGILLHMVIQETENERLFDDGDTGPQRKLYFNELIARFAHHPALVWNLGEENGPAEWSPIAQTHQQRKAMSSYLKKHDPYQHPVLLHTHSTPEAKDEILSPQLGHQPLDGLSFQVEKRETVNAEIQRWFKASSKANRKWLITMDEIGVWQDGALPDSKDPNHNTLRRYALWGTLMGGGAGVEWYFGAKHQATDLTSEDWRLRDRLWTITNHARVFFEEHLPYWSMQAANELADQEDAYVLAKKGEIYAVYLPKVLSTKLDMSASHGEFTVQWFDPLHGGELQQGSRKIVSAGGQVDVGQPPSNVDRDWVVLVKKLEDKNG